MKQKLLISLCILFCFNEILSQTKWELLNPKPTANTGKNIVFVTSNVGYIINDKELLETLDAGSTWTIKQNISSGNDMAFHNTTGLIVGNNGYILKSEDNGASWTQIFTGYTDSFNSVNIIDLENIILSSSNTLTDINNIVKSNDGGLTWERLIIPNQRANLGIPNFKVVKTLFTSSLVGHAICTGGAILKTIDGGLNWYITQSTNIFPSDFFTIYFINETIGFASSEHRNLYKTDDGGETWTEISSISGTSEAIYDFHFINETIGFSTGNHGATYRTGDGGNTWTPIFFQNGFVGNSSMYGIFFQDNNVGYATGERGRIIKTSDGGNTWEAHSLTYNDIRQLQFLDNDIAYANTGSNFYKTINSGESWTLIGSLILGTSVSAGDFTFTNENVGYATTTSTNGGQVYKTTDGGVTWAILNNGFDVIDEGITSIFFLDDNNGFVSGGFNQKKVMKTTDGGNNWIQVSNQKFGKIQFVSDLVGYGNRIGNYFGAMYKTIDGGDTWNISIELEEKNINAFHFVDENNGYFVGDQGLIYKTNDGGTNWLELEIPYEWYTKVNFYSKNIGYIADEEGRLYKTMNGGISWEYLTQHYAINSIELVDDKIFTAGYNGKIYRSGVAYETIVLHVNPAENISNSSVNLTGNITSNEGAVSSIQFEYGTNYSFNHIIPITQTSIVANESLNVSINIPNLNPNTTYYYRLKGNYNSINYTSQILSFTTLNDYEIVTQPAYNYTSTTAQISGNIISNENNITNIVFEYGTTSNTFNNSLSGSPTTVTANTESGITASLINLEPGTQYFFRLKATHQGEIIYGNVQSFTTYPEYYIGLQNPIINGNNVALTASIIAYFQEITNIVFEYGTTNYENQIITNPSQINASNSSLVNATISDLNPNSVYYFRLKGIQNGNTIYSKESVFNFSGDIIIVNGSVEVQDNSLELKGLINSYGAYLSNIQFEYDVTNNFGSSITGKPSGASASSSLLVYGTPNFVVGQGTNLITASISNPLPNQTYYYRLVATYNGNTIYSDVYQFTTGTLSTEDLVSEKQILIYPNPASDFVNIKSNNISKIASIELYDMLGKLTYTQNTLDISDTKIELSHFRKGVYFIKINFKDTKTVFSKLIID